MRLAILAVLAVKTSFAEELTVDQCLAAVNKYRVLAGSSPIGLCEADAQAQSMEQAAYDAVNGPHAHLRDFGWYGFCGPTTPRCQTEYGMCSASGQGGSIGSSYEEALEEFFNLGPGEGHYEGMVSDSNTCVACGYLTDPNASNPRYDTHFNFNWCNTEPVETPNPPQPDPVESTVTLYESDGDGKRVVNWSEFTANFNNDRGGSPAFDVCAGATFDNGSPLWTDQGSNVGKMEVTGNWHVRLSENCGLTFPVDDMAISQEYSAADGLTTFFQLAYLEITNAHVVYGEAQRSSNETKH